MVNGGKCKPGRKFDQTFPCILLAQRSEISQKWSHCRAVARNFFLCEKWFKSAFQAITAKHAQSDQL